MIENSVEDMETEFDAFICPKAHFLQMQGSSKRRRGIPAGFEENEVIYKDLEPKKRFFLDTIILAKDNSTIFVSNQWNEDNFSEFCKVASEKFDIEIELL